jgi:probable rRNA maturation factor
MRLVVEYVKQVPCVLTKTFIVNIVKNTLKFSGYDFLREKKVFTSVVLVSPEEIQKLNKQYRRKNKVTDVLSFPEYIDKKSMASDVAESIVLGDLIVCYDYIVRSADEDGVSLEREMAYIVSHGILHLLGFRHSKKMFALQENVSELYD